MDAAERNENKNLVTFVRSTTGNLINIPSTQTVICHRMNICDERWNVKE